jgi:energy-coupling factor transporter ATP-binding protein EcfA2
MVQIEVIMLTGRSGSGKTTVAKMLKDLIEETRKETPPSVYIMSFSHALKIFTAEMLNKIYSPATLFNHEKMDDQEYKSKTHNDYVFANAPLTVRNALITFGMTMRAIDENAWINALVSSMKNILEEKEYALPITFIIMDNRFINEAEYFYSLASFEGLPIDVYGMEIINRNTSSNFTNENEIDTISGLFNYEKINNNGENLEELKQQLNESALLKTIINNNNNHGTESFASSFTTGIMTVTGGIINK